MRIFCYKISKEDFIKVFGEDSFWNDHEDIRCAPVKSATEKEIQKLSEVMGFDFWGINDYKYIIAD